MSPPSEVEARQLYLLLSPGFLLALIVLVLNDYIFKQLFHNWFTGKLSDVAGLFAFSIFCCALTPRWKRPIFVAVVACFIVWKTELSDPLVDLLSRTSLFAFDRVVDYSDLLALLVLPLSYWYETKPIRSMSVEAAPTVGVAVLSVVAFIATSRAYVTNYEEPLPTYALTQSAWQTLKAINEHFDPDPILSFSILDAFRSEKEATTSIRLRNSCLYIARIMLKSRGKESEISLVRANHRCRSDGKFNQTVQGKDGIVSDAFEKEFIDSLRQILISKQNLADNDR